MFNPSKKSIIESSWQTLNLISLLLFPLSLIFCSLVRLRRYAYQKGFFHSKKFDVPIIIIGNISVGGTGKTPLLIHLIKLLQDSGYKVGVISRGYRATAVKIQEGQSLLIDESMSAEEVGDEPYLISQSTKVPVVIGRKRILSVKKLLSETECNIVLSDDGLQHYALQRDIEICVIDSSRQFGNKLCLPAGPLREKPERINEVDFVIQHQLATTKSHLNDDSKLISQQMAARNNTFDMSLSILIVYPLCEYGQKQQKKIPINDFKGKPVHAIAGIGNPNRFFSQLETFGLLAIPHHFPDHHQYQKEDLLFHDDLPVIMTEKDAVKCFSLFDMNKEEKQLTDQIWVVPVEVNLSDEFMVKLVQKLENNHQ